MSRGEVREDDREMASAGHHGIGLVRSGLAATTRVDMHVGDHAHAPFPAMRPKPRQGCMADRHLAGGESVRVDFIVEIGRASCREGVWQSVYNSGVAVSFKKNNT